MKVKNLFLSMFAIAALAGCSQNEDAPDNPVVGGQEAKVTLKLKGDGAATRTEGAVPNESDEKAIDNLSVFIFNQTSGALVTSAHFAKGAIKTGSVVSIDTKTDGNKVVVIANAAVDKAAFDALFSGVSSLATLRAVQMDLLNTHATDAGQRTIKQTSGKVLQNGWANVVYGSGAQSGVGTATVHMRFVGARIVVNAISWDGVNSGTFQPDPAEFDKEGSTANFTIRGIYLMDANASTRLIPTLAGNTADSPESSGAGVANDYVVLDTRKFGCFEDITADPWNKEDASHPQILSNDLGVAYVTANKPTVTGSQGSVQAISTPAWWYVFGNPAGISQRPTALVVKVGWLKGVKGQLYPGGTEGRDELAANETENRYFTVYFDGVDKGEQLQCGKTYGVTLKLNGNFMPASGTGGGTGGGGSTDPGKPSVDASVEVTVNTSVWRTLDFDKEWK